MAGVAKLDVPKVSSTYEATPRKIDTCHNQEIKDMHFQELRSVLMRTLPEGLPEVDLPWFLSNLLPPVLSKGVEKTITDLTAHHHIANGRWKWFREEPSKSRKVEDKVFADIEVLASKVVEAGKRAMPGKVATTELMCRPRFTEKSESQNGGYKSDAVQMLLETTGAGKKKDTEYYSVDAAINYEFKKSDAVKDVNEVRCSALCDELTPVMSIQQNVQQILSNSAHFLFSDAGRRFRFSVTIENTTMRLWFLSRAACIVSEPFNFILVCPNVRLSACIVG